GDSSRARSQPPTTRECDFATGTSHRPPWCLRCDSVDQSRAVTRLTPPLPPAPSQAVTSHPDENEESRSVSPQDAPARARRFQEREFAHSLQRPACPAQ